MGEDLGYELVGEGEEVVGGHCAWEPGVVFRILGTFVLLFVLFCSLLGWMVRLMVGGGR